MDSTVPVLLASLAYCVKKTSMTVQWGPACMAGHAM